MTLRTGYEFLDTFGDDGDVDAYTSAEWLLSDFTSNKWIIRIGHKNPVHLNWEVELPDGRLLTNAIHEELLVSLKHFLIIGTEGVDGRYSSSADLSKKMRFVCTCRIIDLILINLEEFGIMELGLSALNVDNLKFILHQLASHPSAEESVYNWKYAATDFCLKLINEMSDSDAEKYYKRWPCILDTTSLKQEEIEIDVPLEHIPKLRAALKRAGVCYGNSTVGFHVSGIKLSNIIYRNTLRGKSTPKTKFKSLSFYPNYVSYETEYPRARVTTGVANSLLESTYVTYRSVLASISEVAITSLPAPSSEDTASISEYAANINTSARFRSVPAETLLNLFRKGIEFHIDHGKAVLEGFISVAKYCLDTNSQLSTLPEKDLQKIISPELRELGVQRVGLSCYGEKTGEKKKRVQDRAQYFKQLRGNEGLIEMVIIYMGIIKFTVGALMARRVDELIPLEIDSCLDGTKTWLIFNLEKSTRGAIGMRQVEERPIDEIGSEMIQSLCEFHKELFDLGFTPQIPKLFSTPSLLAKQVLLDPSHENYNRSLDFMCDYLEADLNDLGERHYIRQHQLRRFFAIMFFYTNGFGELDTLRWMLGHRDIEHIWHYLTECLTPSEIAGAGAKYFADLTKSERLENYTDLRELLIEKFGTSKFSLISSDEIEQFLNSMLQEGYAEIQTEFFKTETGKTMRVLFVMRTPKK
jgi:hypothetical protein